MKKDDLNLRDELVITSTYPSSILEDFHKYLNYITSHKLKLTRASGYFTKKDLQAICAHLEDSAAKTDPKLTQTGYPLINLFYHLSITLDFMRVNRTPSTAKALIQKERINQFSALTETEQYVTLLQAFWTEIDWEVLQGEQWGRVPYIPVLLGELEEVPAEEPLDIPMHGELKSLLRGYGQLFHHFSYFGFWRFEKDEEKSKGSPGRPKLTVAKTITLTHFFKKIEEALLDAWDPAGEEPLEQSFELLSSWFELPDQEDLSEAEEEEIPSLISLLKPLFPAGELETILEKPQPIYVKGAYRFAVNMEGGDCKVMELSGSDTLEQLHDAIHEEFDLYDDHLYAFYMDGKKFGKHAYNSPMDVQGPYVDEVRIGELDLQNGQRFLYLYDFGEEREFEVEVVGVPGE
ncbi:plasmid pRiA4b ORF-3 family protein [Bacillus infantis]|uniref:Plasmid pRiA4b ORF-3 family protein n=1 Tax=Bacillus infantis TaxID=324767 RepID=A0A5D4QS80_9BACI|nr:plasmid pRiA4b ORF-3 family protein [Bacillus infantis]TYS40761.1 plasmid pRiA4b ORF-3 family protein [Bacillus infantis]